MFAITSISLLICIAQHVSAQTLQGNQQDRIPFCMKACETFFYSFPCVLGCTKSEDSKTLVYCKGMCLGFKKHFLKSGFDKKNALNGCVAGCNANEQRKQSTDRPAASTSTTVQTTRGLPNSSKLSKIKFYDEMQAVTILVIVLPICFCIVFVIVIIVFKKKNVTKYILRKDTPGLCQLIFRFKTSASHGSVVYTSRAVLSQPTPRYSMYNKYFQEEHLPRYEDLYSK
jgi:hypothetical protein